MLEQLKIEIQKHTNPEIQYAVLREQLQLLILDILSKRGYFKDIAFLGGTALRIIYHIRCYSEDLDFSMLQRGSYEFEELVEVVTKELQLRSLDADIKMKKQIGAVRSCFFRFKGLLYELGLSPLKDQKISIKFDIDENPPQGFATELSLIRGLGFSVNSYDTASMFAGKLHAILSRQYTKGRDYFDLLWFVGSGVQPNLRFLENALEQSSGKKLCLDMKRLKSILQERISETNFDEVISDLRPFIMDESGLKHYNQETFLGVVERQLVG